MVNQSKPIPYDPTNAPPICTVFQHQATRQETHLMILKNLKLHKGIILNVDEQDMDLLFGSMRVKEPSLMQEVEEEDAELKACLESSEECIISFKIQTKKTDIGYQTTFELLDNFDKEWVIQEFDTNMERLIVGIS
jgi:hypothetical protein